MIGCLVLVAMALLARRANRRFGAHTRLPMQFGLNGQPTRSAPRVVALAFLPGLALCTCVPLAILAPQTTGALVAALALLGGQVFYHAMIGRAL